MRKSYRMLAERGYKNLSIMSAAVRGPWHIQNSMAPVDGATFLITTVTGKIKELYRTPDLFTIALFDEPGVPTEVADAMQQCASMVVSPADQAKADAKAKTDANSAPAQNGK